MVSGSFLTTNGAIIELVLGLVPGASELEHI